MTHIICVTVAESVAHTPDSTITPCSVCAEDVWISKSGRAVDAIPICMRCAAADPRYEEGARIEVTPAMLEELHASGITDAQIEAARREADRMLRRHHRRCPKGQQP